MRDGSDVTKSVRLDEVKLKEPRTLSVADLKDDGSPDFVVTQAGGETLVLENVGANQNHWMQIDLKALNDNKSSIGTKLEHILQAVLVPEVGKLQERQAIWDRTRPGCLWGWGRKKPRM